VFQVCQHDETRDDETRRQQAAASTMKELKRQNKGVTYTAENIECDCQAPCGRARTPTFGKKLMNPTLNAVASLGLLLAVTACDQSKLTTPKVSAASEEHKPPRLPSPDDTLMILALYESVARQAWSSVGDRLLAGEREVTFEGESGQVGFIRAEENFSQPSHYYMMGGRIKGFVEIIRQGAEVQRVILRPGEFGFVTHYTTIQLWEKDSFLKPDSEQEAEQAVAPNRSLPPNLKSTSPVRGPED
jgi:hypothetical protein